jgi:hypothetical protein
MRFFFDILSTLIIKGGIAMTASEIINAIINGFIAVGTIAVAILAIWGDSIRARFVGPKLSLVPHNNLKGEVVPLTNRPRAIYYHLKVVNARKTVSATNCRVLLNKIWRRIPNGAFQEVKFAVPLTFVWAPAEITPPYITLVKEHHLDFCRVCEGEHNILPLLLSYTNNFQGLVQANEVVRFWLEIVGDNFVSPNLQIFEVAWNGQWSDNLDIMSQNLQIQEVTDQSPAT